MMMVVMTGSRITEDHPRERRKRNANANIDPCLRSCCGPEKNRREQC
jgi:hypothetical protein